MTDREREILVRSMEIVVDSREREDSATFKPRVKRLYELSGNLLERQKLNVGDYSCKGYLPDGTLLDLTGKVAIERKESLDEAVGNLLTEKQRFERELTRAKDIGEKVYFLIENASFTKIYNGTFPHHPFAKKQSVIGSLFSLMARYNLHLIFCKPEQTADIIYEILSKELVEHAEPKDAHRFEVQDDKPKRTRKSKEH